MNREGEASFWVLLNAERLLLKAGPCKCPGQREMVQTTMFTVQINFQYKQRELFLWECERERMGGGRAEQKRKTRNE